jgi:hypothetical protein
MIKKLLILFLTFLQCCGSGSACGSGSVCIWASRIRIQIQYSHKCGSGSVSFQHLAKKEENLDFDCLGLLFDFLIAKNDVNVLVLRIRIRMFLETQIRIRNR